MKTFKGNSFISFTFLENTRKLELRAAGNTGEWGGSCPNRTGTAIEMNITATLPLDKRPIFFLKPNIDPQTSSLTSNFRLEGAF
jgi:hypothetical protein